MLAAAARGESGYIAAMVSVLKHRLALAVLVGVLVIPVLSVNCRTCCSARQRWRFAVSSPDGSDGAAVTSSTTLSRDQPTITFEGRGALGEACEGVRAQVSAIPISDERVGLTITIINESDLPWRGSVGLAAEGDANNADLTAALGQVEPGGSESASLELRILPGQTEIQGTLLLGP